MTLKKNAILGSGWSLRPADDSQRAVDMANRLQDDLNDLLTPFDACLWEILSCLDFGFSLQECVFSYDKGRIRLRKLLSIAPHDLLLNQDPSGRLSSIQQFQGRGLVELPLGKMVYVVYRSEFGSAYGISDLRECYTAWFAKTQWMAWLNIFGEMLATPPVLGKTPMNAGKAQNDSVMDVLSRLQAKTAMLVPEGYDVKLLESSRSPQEMFVSVLQFWDQQITKSLLVPDRSGIASPSTTGSYNLASEQSALFQLTVRQLQAWLSGVLRRQLLSPMAYLVAGAGADGIVPDFVLSSPSETNLSLAAGIVAGVNANALTRDAGLEGALRELFGLPPLEAAATPSQPSPAAPPTKPSEPPSQPSPKQRPAPMVGSKFTAPVLKQ
jgi:phage gp29-like protein